jgi:YVTN family beta-propeller protein
MKKFQLVVAIGVVAAAIITPTAQGLASTLSNPTGPSDPNATLPTTNVVQLVVDSAHHQLFISTGLATDSLLVTDDSGVVRHTIALAGAEGITLEGGKLFVAESGASDVAVIDTRNLKVTHRYSTGAGTCPESVALVASRYLTVGLDCANQVGSVAVLDLTTRASTPSVVPATSFYYPLVRAVPNSTTAIVGEAGLDPSRVSIVEAAGTPVVTKTLWELANGCENLQDLAVSPDGRSFVPACGAPYHHDVFSTTDLSQTDTYQTGTYPDAAAFSPSGLEFAGGTGFSYAKVLYVFSTTPGNHVVGLAADLGTPWDVAPQGVGFSSNGQVVFAVTKAWFGTGTWTYHLHAISVAPTPVVVDVSAPATSAVGAPLQVTGSIAFADGQQHAVQLEVTRRLKGVTTTLPAVTTSGAGNVLSFTDTPAARGKVTYTVEFAGDAFNKPGSDTAKVNVR